MSRALTVGAVGNFRFRQRGTAYAAGELAYSDALPAGWWLECLTSGTSAQAELTVGTPVPDALVVDGTVTWRVCRPITVDGVPVGTVIPWSSNSSTLPAGYLLCNGAAVSRTMYPQLFTAVGTLYGAGDGETTFNLPDLRDKFIEGSDTAGAEVAAGLPNITGRAVIGVRASNGSSNSTQIGTTNGAFGTESSISSRPYFSPAGSVSSPNGGVVTFDASKSNTIYGNSTTVQPPSLTMRYLIKAFDTRSAASALVDVTQYAADLATRLQRQQVPAFNHRDVVTVSGTYVAPVTGWYRITVKGGGGGGGGGGVLTAGTYLAHSGDGGGEGGLTVEHVYMYADDEASVVIGAGGTGSSGSSSSSVLPQPAPTNGGDSSVTIGNHTYTAGGAQGQQGGNGTVCGAPGVMGYVMYGNGHSAVALGAPGGGAGGGKGSSAAGVFGGGGAGGNARGNATVIMDAGGKGGDGVVIFEYFDPVLNLQT